MTGSGRAIAAAARRLSPVDFAPFTAGKGEDLKHLSITLKQMISQAIGREVAGETSLAISI